MTGIFLKRFNTKWLYPLSLLLISFITHFRWLTLQIFTYHDWRYLSSVNIKSYISLPLDAAWRQGVNFGSAEVQPYFFIFRYIWGFFSYLPEPYILGLFFIYFLPIIVVPPLASFYLLRLFIKNSLYSFIGSIIYTFSTYFLVLQTAHLTIALAYALAPLFLFIFYKYLFRLSEKSNLVFVVLVSLISTLQLLLEPRVFYILILLLIPGVLFICRGFKNHIQAAVLLLLLNAHWIFFILNSGFSGIAKLTSRSLFGNEFRSLAHALTSMQPSWTWSIPSPFSLEQILPFFWIMPLFAFGGLLFFHRNQNKKTTLFFYTLALIGIFLAKQSHEPFSDLYGWLYTNFPGFSFYRESSKFYILTVIAYAYLIPTTLSNLFDYLKGKYGKNIFYSFKIAIIASILYCALLPTLPLLTGGIGAMFEPRQIPEDYTIFSRFIENQPDYYRSLWVPQDSKWVEHSNLHPKVGAISASQQGWSSLLPSSYRKIQNHIANIFKMPFASDLMNNSSIRYVAIPIQDFDNDDDFFASYGGDKNPYIRQWYIDQLDAIPWLKRVDIGTKDLVVYENEGYKPYITSFVSLYALDSFANLDKKHDFLTSQGDKDFLFAVRSANASLKPLVEVSDPFERLQPGDILPGTIAGNATSTPEKDTAFVVFKKLQGKAAASTSGGTSTVSYTDPSVSAVNIIPDGSFESGSWQEKVGDCNGYDNKPVLAMSLNTTEITDGAQSLQLEATRHIACVSKTVAVKGGEHYLLSFDYQSPNAKYASYYVGFNDPDKTVINDDLPIEGTGWQSLSKVLDIPAGTTQLSFFIYANATDGQTNIINRYDNVSLIEIPDIVGAYYLVSEPDAQLVQPASTTFELISPTKKLVHIKGATMPFFLSMSESYHDKWQLELNNAKVQGRLGGWWPFAKPDKVPDEYHYQLDGFLNAWYVDTTQLCEVQKLAGCTQNPDGSYDIEMVIEFWPQRWFYLGLIVSGLTLAGCLGYLGYAGVGHVRRKYRSRAH